MHHLFAGLLTSWVLCTLPIQLAFAGAADAPITVGHCLATKWLSEAKQIWIPERVIYYRGNASGYFTADKKHWYGEITGEILVLTSTSASAARQIEIRPPSHFSSDNYRAPEGLILLGAHSTEVHPKSVPHWKELLKERKSNGD